MALNSFGSVFAHAIQQEADIAAYFKALGMLEHAAEAEKRKQKLERARREHVLEITLEPIEGLNEEDYALNTADTSSEGQATVAQTAARFYRDAAPKINVRQAQRVLERCGKSYQDMS